ncbi:MAG: hypothetical protein KIT09_32815 [Bryobacteraceae bacterium]|nr:hypothetical protein [Bryobacteraceae bacterium]
MNLRAAFLAAVAAPALLLAQEPRNMTGAWELDVNHSIWGNASKPLYVVMRIEHQEPLLRYSGVVAYGDEETRQLTFDGRIDGQEYAMTRSFGAGRIVIRRTSASAIRSVFTTHDGRYVETATTTVSRDGKTLTRRIHVKGPSNETEWTEIYRRD